ncbi:hypothetical protein [Haloarchaeobius sp. HME9146]|uniref:hypothetical protein n=1 Tax=Haloarchaeobius sp. HME9146 TaxID=2978732 RepID=UPI0021BF6895|nr:hypothetical protein [Haloarchaeobius sp. HME9146]MCT9097303.1 hypothetical protein [Haloarchaeobius sp. HME9146]
MTDQPDAEDGSERPETQPDTEPDTDLAADLATQDPTPAIAVLAEGLRPMLDLATSATGGLGLPEPAVLADDVCSLPPEERFRESASRYANRFGMGGLTDPDSLDALAADLPLTDPVQTGVRTVVRNAGRWQGQLLAQLLAEPDDPGPYLALVMLLERLERTALAVQTRQEGGAGAEGSARADDDETLPHLLSTELAILARLVRLVTDEDATVDDEVYLDAALASYHLEAATGTAPEADPREKSADERRRIVHLQGAMLAVDTLDLPADQVAELTGVDPSLVLAAVGRRDESHRDDS